MRASLISLLFAIGSLQSLAFAETNSKHAPESYTAPDWPPPSVFNNPDDATQEDSYQRTKIAFVTNRTVNRQARSAKLLRGDPMFQNVEDRLMTVGIAEVGAPIDRKAGDLSYCATQNNKTGAKCFSLEQASLLNQNEFLEELKGQTNNSEITFYIHGFNVDFHDAAERATQLSIDLDLSHPLVLFSWPSFKFELDQTKIVESTLHNFSYYSKSISRTEKAAHQLASIISFLSREDFEINIIAHSMGGRVTSTAINKLHGEPAVRRIIFAAADIPVDSNQIPTSTGSTKSDSRMYSFCSHSDTILSAIKLSGVRLGDCSHKDGNVSTLMETVEALNCNGKTEHNYYANSIELITALKALLESNLSKLPARELLMKNEALKVLVNGASTTLIYDGEKTTLTRALKRRLRQISCN